MRVTLHDVSKVYQDKTILDSIDLHVEDKQAIAIIGPSGAGKSTLLRLLAKIEEPTNGSLMVNGAALANVKASEYYKSIGFVFQTHNLFPHVSALQNITLPLTKVHHKSEIEAKSRAAYLLKQFGLSAHQNKRPSKLSGGQSQRVSIARSIAHEPALVFLDEPTASLDPVLSQEVLETILKLKQNRIDFVIVTHEIMFAKKVADLIIYMEDGKIVEVGDASILKEPKTQALRAFLKNVYIHA